ncbi:GDP-fucose protein O-fucosyltransferase 2, putative [Plasmodium gallinaceum]|uniref:GDP-fucose protein O-fucosyltransferase 2 n=1 Tax=Plasmodium gallinaceum TaxID=5849 RepID=A0A1J1GVR4_PLAGA|nr:GDP-fucose protein O-fucosyltransferase 2, putative [Plasmodium gallinaceum]CRG96640.1 GDP-fucose protein O-fucosyltransferase 2, putative [Plasmodium gallinaceum]
MMKITNLFLILIHLSFFKTINSNKNNIPYSICHKNDVYLGDDFYFLKNKKYVLYDVNIGEGFNLQKEVLYRISLVVYYLNKKDKNNIYYLVLPPWCYLAHWNNKKHKKIKWNFFFNLKVIQNVIPVIEFPEYSKIYGSNTDFIISFKFRFSNILPNKGSFDVLSFDKCPIEGFNFKNICKKCENKYSVTYSGNCTNIKAKNCECYEYNFITSFFASNIIYNLFFYDVDSILIKQGSSILVPFVNELFENNLEDILLFSEDLIEEGNNYVKKILKTTNYLSSHLRYTDFRKISYYDVPPINISIFKLLYIMFMNENEKIFISTDEKKEVQKIVNQEFNEFKNYFYFYENENYHEGEVAIIDQWICIKSKIFVGNIFSRYSLHIKWERYLMNTYEKKNLDLCGYNINNDEKLRKNYKNIKDIYNKKALIKLKHIYDNYSEKDKKYLNTICLGFNSHFPKNTSIYRLKYINHL